MEREAEREKRVAELGRKVSRRILNAGLSRGWEAWHSKWAQAVRERQLLAGAANRMLRPALYACFSTWLREWAAAQRKAFASTWEGKLALAEEARATLEADVAELQKELQSPEALHGEPSAEKLAEMQAA